MEGTWDTPTDAFQASPEADPGLRDTDALQHDVQGASRPLPTAVKLLALVTIGLALPLLLRMPRLLEMAVLHERCSKAYHNGQAELATLAGRQYLDFDPTSGDTWARVGLSLLQLNRIEEAEAALRQADRLGVSPHLRDEMSHAYLAIRDLKKQR